MPTANPGAGWRPFFHRKAQTCDGQFVRSSRQPHCRYSCSLFLVSPLWILKSNRSPINAYEPRRDSLSHRVGHHRTGFRIVKWQAHDGTAGYAAACTSHRGVGRNICIDWRDGVFGRPELNYRNSALTAVYKTHFVRTRRTRLLDRRDFIGRNRMASARD